MKEMRYADGSEIPFYYLNVTKLSDDQLELLQSAFVCNRTLGDVVAEQDRRMITERVTERGWDGDILRTIVKNLSGHDPFK